VHAALRKRLERGLRQIAFFVVPSVAAFIFIGRMLVAALYQTGEFRDDQTLYVWYILVGSTVGLLAMTLGRLYSSAFYALRDTRTPLRFAIARVILTGVLGYLFAFPLRWLLVDAIQALHMPIPASVGGAAAMGTVGLTASAGIAGWLEYLLLRSALSRRVGTVRIAPAYVARLWVSALAAAGASVAFARYALPRLALPHVVPHIRDGILVCVVFGAVYFVVAILAGVPEAKATLGRLKRR
jgi:putative peptidoglycan lipid II flippase